MITCSCKDYVWACRFTVQAATQRPRLGGVLEQKAHRGDGGSVGGTIVDVADELALEVVPLLLVEAVRHKTSNAFEVRKVAGHGEFDGHRVE